MKSFPLLLVSAALILGALPACSKKSSDAGHDHTAASNSHAHHAPHDGTLIALGQHRYNLEFVHDAAAGKLTAYLLDAHAENFIRSPLAAINLTVEVNGTPTPLRLAAVANSATGETVGNTSEYLAEADWLKSAVPPLRIVIPVLMIRDTTFTNITGTIEPPAKR